MAAVDAVVSVPGAGPEDPILPSPFRWDGPHVGITLGAGQVLFTTRRGGTSRPPWDSLNLGSQVGDDSSDVEANRERVAAYAGIKWQHVRHGRQVHGAAVQRHHGPKAARAQSASSVAGIYANGQIDADGQVVAGAGPAALVLVADCLPVVVVSRDAVAALHAGWRGLAAGILGEGVRALRESDGDTPLQAALGPCARSCCYEVGEEVHKHFDGYGARRGTRHLDLAYIARQQLKGHGVEVIADCDLCTMCHPALFFSHRRDAGRTGRQGALAWLA